MTHASQRFCLRWNNHQSNLLSVFDQLLHDESFVDVTLAVEGQLLRAHKMVLSACSPYFQALFVNHPDKHPIVILKDVPFADMRSLLDFMYHGEVSVDQDRLTAFLKVAESLRIKGLTEVNEEKCDLPSIASSLLSNNQQRQTTSPPSVPPPPPNLHRIHLSQPSPSPSATSSSTKRCAPSPSNFSLYPGNNVSSLYGQKRKRGRPRKLSGSSDTPSVASPDHELNTDSDNRHSAQSNLSDSSYAHGPPDLLEVNMTEHSHNSPGSFSEEQNIRSLEQEMTRDTSEECCIKTEPNEDSTVPGTSFQDRKSPQLKESSSSRSLSQTPTNQSERYIPDKCHWKEILKRLKKPEISIHVENDDNNKNSSDEQAPSRKSEIASKNANNNVSKVVYSSQAEGYYSSETFAGTSGSVKDATWYSESNSTPYFVDAEGDDLEDEDEAMLKYEYDSLRSSVASGNANSSPSGAITGSPATTTTGGVHVMEHTKPLDKSSVRRYCVQVAEHLFQCTLCYKTYTHISNFSRHFLSAHHGLRQEIPCPVCYRIFTRRDNMLTHMKQVHRITVTRGLATSLIQKLSAANESANSTESQINSN